MNERLLIEVISELLLEKTGSRSEDLFRTGFINYATSASEPLSKPSKIETYGALDRGGLTAYKNNYGSARQFKVGSSASWAAMLKSYVQSIEGSYTNLGKGVHRSGYDTHEIKIAGDTYYYIFDDLSARGVSGSLLSVKNLGKAAEYAIAAAMKSMVWGDHSPFDQVNDPLLAELFGKFLEETPEGKKVTVASVDEQTKFEDAFNQMAQAVWYALDVAEQAESGSGKFKGADVDIIRDAIADIKTNKADVHVKLNSKRLGGVHRMADIPLPASDTPLELANPDDRQGPGGEIEHGRSTDIYERVVNDILDNPDMYGITIPTSVYSLKKKQTAKLHQEYPPQSFCSQL